MDTRLYRFLSLTYSPALAEAMVRRDRREASAAAANHPSTIDRRTFPRPTA